jgi:SHS2 domain-containing protein
MRGKVARELRKATGFNPNKERNYNVVEVIRTKNIMQFDSVNKTVKLVPKEVPCNIVENTDPERILYKYYKKKYYDLNKEELVLNQLPKTEVLNDITEKIIGEQRELQRSKEGIQSIAGGGLPSETNSSGREEN